MYPLNPDKIYAHAALKTNPDAQVRLARFLKTMKRDESEVQWFTPEEAVQVSQEVAAWQGNHELADWKFRQPIIFTNFVLEGKVQDDPIFQNRPLDTPLFDLPKVLGYLPVFTPHHTPEKDAESGMVCWPSMFIASVDGCSHGCVYCGTGRGGKALVIVLNVKEYLDKGIRKVIEDNPWQKCFLMMGSADIATLEPEYGLYEDYLTLLSEYEDRYGYFHTNGDCTEWVEDLTHPERLIGIWSLCSNEASALLEPCAPPASSRIEAMAVLNRNNIPVRIKLKPVLPIKGWRESYGNCIAEVFEKVKPETFGFTSIIWTPYERLVALFGEDQLDPEYMAAAKEAKEEMDQSRHAPFPHHVRAEIYRHLIKEVRKHDKTIPLFISTETAEMWDELKDELGQSPDRFFCGCNPVQGPGPRYVDSTLQESNYRTNKYGLDS